MSRPAQEIALEKWMASGLRCIGQIVIQTRAEGGFKLRHRDDESRAGLTFFAHAEDASEIARFDDAENYRPLKTAPNLRHGWELQLDDYAGVRLALDLFYPGRLAAFFNLENGTLTTTPLRETLDRQTGMYRAAAKITDTDADTLVGNFCRSDGGCLRTILWRRDATGTVATSCLPTEKFDPRKDQTRGGAPVIPLICQEACNFLIAEARKIAKGGAASDSVVPSETVESHDDTDR